MSYEPCCNICGERIRADAVDSILTAWISSITAPAYGGQPVTLARPIQATGHVCNDCRFKYQIPDELGESPCAG